MFNNWLTCSENSTRCFHEADKTTPVWCCAVGREYTLLTRLKTMIIYGLKHAVQCPVFSHLFYLFWDLVTAWTMLKGAVPRADRLSSRSQHSWPVPWTESSEDPPSPGRVSETHFIMCVSTYYMMFFLCTS